MPSSPPWYMRPDYIEATMSSWSPTDIDWSAVSLCLAPEPKRRDNSGVHGSINLVQLGIRRDVQLSGHNAPVDVAIYTLRSPSASLPSSADHATGAGPSSPSRPNVSSPARRKDTLGRRKKDCELVHLCPICETTFTRKWSLEGHIKAHDDKKEFACKIPGCKDRFNTKAHLKSHLKNRHHVS